MSSSSGSSGNVCNDNSFIMK